MSVKEIEERNYNLDIKNPHSPEGESDDPEELLTEYHRLTAEFEKCRDALKQELINSLERRG